MVTGGAEVQPPSFGEGTHLAATSLPTPVCLDQLSWLVSTAQRFKGRSASLRQVQLFPLNDSSGSFHICHASARLTC